MKRLKIPVLFAIGLGVLSMLAALAANYLTN